MAPELTKGMDDPERVAAEIHQAAKEDRIRRRCEYHKASPPTRELHEEVSETCTGLAMQILGTTQESREQAMALTKLDELRMWWNAAVAFDGQGFDPATR